MSVLERIQELCNQKDGCTITSLEKELGFGKSTISKWKDSVPNTDKLLKVADYFHVSLDFLMGREELKLNRRDHQDIEKLLNDARDQLLTSEGLMFDGNPATEEEIQQILDAMQIGLEMAKKKNKEKFTPKKYRK